MQVTIAVLGALLVSQSNAVEVTIKDKAGNKLYSVNLETGPNETPIVSYDENGNL